MNTQGCSLVKRDFEPISVLDIVKKMILLQEIQINHYDLVSQTFPHRFGDSPHRLESVIGIDKWRKTSIRNIFPRKSFITRRYSLPLPPSRMLQRNYGWEMELREGNISENQHFLANFLVLFVVFRVNFSASQCLMAYHIFFAGSCGVGWGELGVCFLRFPRPWLHKSYVLFSELPKTSFFFLFFFFLSHSSSRRRPEERERETDKTRRWGKRKKICASSLADSSPLIIFKVKWTKTGLC